MALRQEAAQSNDLDDEDDDAEYNEASSRLHGEQDFQEH